MLVLIFCDFCSFMSVACTTLNKLLTVVFLWLIMLSLPVYHSSMITLSIYGVWAACSRA